jgi:hypothetical protein
MKIGVENLGTIKKGEIDLSNNLIILTGGNNQGKSYMAYLIYGFYKMKHTKAKNNNIYKRYASISKKELEGSNIFQKYITEKGVIINPKKIIQDNHEVYCKIYNKALFDLSNEIFASKEIKPKYNIFEDFKDIAHNRIFTEHIISFGGEKLTLNFDGKTLSIKTKHHINDNVLISALSSIFVTTKIGNFYFFPAERTAIHLLSKEIFKEKAMERDEIASRVQRGEDLQSIVQDLNERGTFVPRYPLAISDYLYFANDLGHITSQPETEYADLADDLEAILGGKISVSSFGDIQFKPKGKRKTLPLHLSSSLVKSLSGLAIQLRHLAQKGDILIIDEPELNLHPDNQVLIARFLAKLANRGFKVIFSTHSDYMLKELSNLVIMSNEFPSRDNLAQKYGLEKEQFLKPETVSVYAFQNNTIDAVAVTKEGISIDKIEKSIADLSERSDDIFYSFEEESATVA